jgi:sporadic carbohydrate cluster 2OG-Fe(II) oxygenase/sporadic carbohydrate cluster protein (TIGR04323 family)
MLIETLPEFDAATMTFDLERYPFPRWALEQVRAAGYDLDDLSRLHEVVEPHDQPALTKRLIRMAGEPEFQELLHAFVHEYIEPLLGAAPAIQRYPNVRVVRPKRPEMVLPYHQGRWVGHGWGEATIWLPLTKAFDTNTMRIMGLEKSREVTLRCTRERWSKAKMEEVLGALCEPCNIDPGTAVCFTQGNIHGNVENLTGVTRVSMDVRVLEPGGQFHRKSPGGYFVIPGTYGTISAQSQFERRADDQQKVTISYCESQTQMTSGIPIPLQRLAIREYVEARNIKFSYEHVELEGLLHCPILMGLIEQDRPDEIVLYSIFSLPDDPADRKAVLDAALRNGVVLHFVNELATLADEEDRVAIDRTIEFTRDFSSPVVSTRDVAA